MCSDDKIKRVKPLPLYPQNLEGLKEGRLEFAEVREDGEPSSISL